MSGGSRRSGLWPWRNGLGRLALHDIDTPFEVSAVLDDDASGLDIADEFGVFADIDFVQCLDVAINGPEHDDLARFDARANSPIGPYCEAMFIQFDGAFDFTVNDQIFTAEDLTLDGHRFSYAGGAATGFVICSFYGCGGH